jgi:hypothetical protein
MSVGMRRKCDRTVGEVRAEALVPTSLLVVDDFIGIATTLAGKYVGHAGLVCRVICATSIASLLDELYRRPKQEPGRPPLRGALIDLFLAPYCNPAGETALDVVVWLEDGRYPLLPVLLYTSADDYSIEHMCRLRGVSFVHPDDGLPRQLVDRPNEAVRAALRGVIVRPDLRAVPVFDKHTLFEDPEVLRYIEREIFGPWNDLVLEGRAFAIETAREAAVALTEGLFRTLDAILSGFLDVVGVASSRGLKRGSAEQDLQVLRDVLGRHERIFGLWTQWLRTLHGDPLAGNRWQPVLPENPSPPEPGRRVSARRRR